MVYIKNRENLNTLLLKKNSICVIFTYFVFFFLYIYNAVASYMVNLLYFPATHYKVRLQKNQEIVNIFTIDEKLKLTYFVHSDTFTRLQLKK